MRLFAALVIDESCDRSCSGGGRVGRDAAQRHPTHRVRSRLEQNVHYVSQTCMRLRTATTNLAPSWPSPVQFSSVQFGSFPEHVFLFFVFIFL